MIIKIIAANFFIIHIYLLKTKRANNPKDYWLKGSKFILNLFYDGTPS